MFDTVAHIERYREAVADIVKIEFLSEQKEGVGTRFRETRLMKGREASADLEVTEYESSRHVRLVADSHGTVWDCVFQLRNQMAVASCP